MEIPVKNTRYQNDQEGLKSTDLSLKVEDILGKFAKEQAVNRASVKELQTTIGTLENKLSNKNEETQANVEELRATIAMLENKLSNINEETQVNIENEAPKKETRVLVVSDSGEFHSGQAFINENLINAVKELVPDILASPDDRIVVEGHTDNIPIKSSTGKGYMDNMELSFFRAKAITRILVKNGISPDRISVIGYGDTRPIASNETAGGRAKNRRVEVKLIPEDEDF